MTFPPPTRRRLTIDWRIVVSALLLLALWWLWPQISLFFYRRSGLNGTSVPYLGQFGDLFGGLTSLFTLGALVFSIYVNYLQYRQFQELRHQEVLNNHRFVNGMLMDDVIMDAAYMVQYGGFGYRGHPGYSNVKEKQYFNDLRMPKDQRDAHSDETERKIDKLLMCYEQILVLLESGMLDENLSIPYRRKINLCVERKDVQAYLFNLVEYYGSAEETPYMRLALLADEQRRKQEAIQSTLRRASLPGN